MMESRLFYNGVFWPLPNGGSESALLAQGERIIALGDEALARAAGAERIDLEGRVAIPGPVDAHCHLVSYGMQRTREADLRGARSLMEIASRLLAHPAAQAPGRWLLGRGFEQDLLEERRWPTRQDLDRICAERPLRITRVCGHAMVANTAALRAAGLDPDAKLEGFPEGVLTETAMAPIYRAIPEPGAEEWRAAALAACKEAARAGFVGVHSIMANLHETKALSHLAEDAPLPVRVLMHVPFSLLSAAQWGRHAQATSPPTPHLELAAIKLFSDGSLGARTAYLLEPYADDPGTVGELIYSPHELAKNVGRVYEAGFQVCIHAIGDGAMEATLDAIEMAIAARAASGRAPVPPARIEHASVVNPRIVERMVRLEVGAAVQPQFAWSDYWTPDRLGPERTAGAYAFRTLHEAGVPLAGSTDCPVEILSAMAAIGAMVHRPEWSPQEALPLETTLRIFSEGAYALQGQRNGRLQPGDYADFIVLDRDPRAVDAAEIRDIKPVMTVVGGAASP